MATNEEYKSHLSILKIEQKIARMKRELESVNYGDGCPIHGENDCADVRKAYDRGYTEGAYEVLKMLGLMEGADDE